MTSGTAGVADDDAGVLVPTLLVALEALRALDLVESVAFVGLPRRGDPPASAPGQEESAVTGGDGQTVRRRP